jgi:iron complex outermembrane receptor protein
VVTAQRRAERLAEVPIAITAVGGEQLEAAGLRGTLDLPSVTPGLSFNTLAGGAVVFLRGVGTTNPVVGNESSVALYVDGLYQPSFKGSTFSFDNVERVEVLKGPQGTLFGRNATGGAIQVIFKDPSHDTAFSADAAYENYDTVQLSAYGTTGLATNLAADLSVYYRDQNEGFGTNLTTGDENMLGHEFAARSKWLLDIGDRTRVTAAVSYFELDNSSGSSFQFLPGAFGVIGETTNGNIFDTRSTRNNRLTVDQLTGVLRIEHEADFATLISISGFSRTKSYFYFDIDQQSLPLIDADLPERNRALSQEIQLQSPADSPVKWIGGVYLYENIARYPIQLSGILFGALVQQNQTRQRATSMAAFGQTTVPISGGLSLTLGARYTIDDLSYSAAQEFSGFPSVPPFKLPAVSFSKPTWRIALDQKFGGSLLYASFNRGYKTGAYNLINVSADAPALPEELDAYEIGAKLSLFDRLLNIDVAGFLYKYSELQVLVNQGSLAITRNAADVTVKGFEVQATARPVPRLTLHGGLSYLDGRFDSYPDAVFYEPSLAGGNTLLPGRSAAGNRLPQSPEFTFNLSANYTIPTRHGDFALSANHFHKGAFFWHPDNRIRQDSYDLVNVTLQWTSPDDRFRAKVFARNLFDEEYYIDVQESVFGDFGTPGSPRTYGVSVGVSF